MDVRLAKAEDLGRVNELRKQVNDLHSEGKPDVFKKGFSQELQDYIKVIYNDPEQKIAVAETDGVICGYAVLHHITKPENSVMYVRDYLDIDEFGVDEAFRRRRPAS